LKMERGRLLVIVGDETLEIARGPIEQLRTGSDALPDDVSSHIPTP